MKWINHQIVTGVAIYAVTDNPLYAVFSMAGALIPDKLEGNPRNASDYWQWRSSHRGWSHWPAVYLAVIAAIIIIHHNELTSLEVWDLSNILLYMMIGALLHIAEDAVCGKVPLIGFFHPVGIKLFSVGSFTEYLFSMACVLMIYIFKMGG